LLHRIVCTPDMLARAVLLMAPLAVVLGSQTACDDSVIGPEPPVTAYCNREPKLTYDNFGRGYMNQWCTGCHAARLRPYQRNGAPPDVNLDTFDDVMLHAERIQVRSVDSTTMPPTGTPSEAEVQALGEWLRCDVYPSINRQGDGA
jgi:uncharacterized membrane protein